MNYNKANKADIPEQDHTHDSGIADFLWSLFDAA
jgi:hypothetical protein